MKTILNGLVYGNTPEASHIARQALSALDGLTKAQRSILAYAECCAVDAGGLMESIRMNQEDHHNLQLFALAGLLRYGRVHSSLLGTGPANTSYTHWVELTDAGRLLVALVREKRAEHRGPFATKVFDKAREMEQTA